MFLKSASIVWVGTGIISGGVISGMKKVVRVIQEPSPTYKNEFIESPIQMVYCLSRIFAHAGVGAVIGGIVAVTAPVSIPLYMLVKT
jgi:hypothetical protein